MPQAVRSANAPNITASIADSPKADLPLSLSLSSSSSSFILVSSLSIIHSLNQIHLRF